jgi:uncharacterized metal-binding protein YceD (DUF177 family)
MGKILTKYDINIHGLEEKVHEFEFEGSKDFFGAFEQDIIESGQFSAKVTLDKSTTMMRLVFDINGILNLVCDRSLEDFEEPFSISEKYIYKYGDRNEVISDEIEIIPFGTPKINVSQHIFDFISLSVPMKKLHPRFRNEDEDPDAELLIYSDEVSEKAKEKESDTEASDPRWAALLKLKNKE